MANQRAEPTNQAINKAAIENQIEIHLRLFGLGKQAAGREEQAVRLTGGDTVSTLVKRLRSGHDNRLPAHLSEEGLLILVNGRSVHLLQGLDTPLTNGDQVTIMPKAFGG